MSTVDVILYPTDFSEDCVQACELACSVARDQFASLVVLHVLPNEEGSDFCSDANINQEDDPTVVNCREQFQQIKAVAADLPVSFRLKRGPAVKTILDVAEEEEADLIVIASHQFSRFEHELHQGITQGVLNEAHCPVMVLQKS